MAQSPNLSCDQCRFYRVIKIDLVDRGVRLRALPANAVDVSVHTLRHDFFDLAEAQRGAQTSGKTHRFLCSAFGKVCNRRQRSVYHIDGEAYRMRERWIQEQELRHAQGTNLGGISLAVSLKGRTGFQQANPLQIFLALDRLIERMRQAYEMCTDQSSQRFGTLHKAA